MLSLPLRGAGSGDGPSPAGPKPRPSTRCGITHHLRLPRGIDRRLPAQGCPRCGDVLWSQTNHAHSMVDTTPSSTTVAMASATTVLIGQARWRRSRKRGRGRVVGAWNGEREKRQRRQEVSYINLWITYRRGWIKHKLISYGALCFIFLLAIKFKRAKRFN